MPRRSEYEEEYYDDEDYGDSNRREPRRFKKEDTVDTKRKWERERYFDRDHDYDERR